MDALTLSGPGFSGVPGPGREGRGGRGGSVPSKIIHGIETNFGRIVENRKLINLV